MIEFGRAFGFCGLLALALSPFALGAPKTCVETLREGPPFRVALWNSGACSEECIDKTFVVLSGLQPILQLERFRTRQFQKGDLQYFDALVIPGGYMDQYQPAVGEKGAASIREFVASGGIYLGVCAGAYACSQGHYKPFFVPEGVLSYPSVGRGFVTLELTHEGKELWGENETIPFVKYVNGPSLALAPSARRATVLARFLEFESFQPPTLDHPPEGPEMGSIAALKCPYGKGTCLLFSPHPEQSPGFEWLLSDALVHELQAKRP